MSRKRCGSLRGQGWKYGSGFVDGIFPVLSPVTRQILNFVRKNVAVQLSLNKQWDPIALDVCTIFFSSIIKTEPSIVQISLKWLVLQLVYGILIYQHFPTAK
ncbi:hypothetical protein OIU84_001249 [Salix udensis]|uniref:Uncharacterized protein n=1 Tax=Salix udensis TaxID=889485 RepID=A0AAD6K8H4_9ROSI|nr:hypothetical protein OIU84_001249 [Salix udensis]